ncbi:hypothetical protein N0V84_005428 [Fusarium piperis]|uniref:Uncharacterized protein n=1 Tax=Fusarium piperis TaxID=1435070 RepID=A0A9W9BPJ0_9HYPO|nr:hypothetical protein N0V84_005428 [Fusarium piperis]
MDVPFEVPIQTRPDDGGSWFELPQDPNTFVTATMAAIPTVNPTGLTEETPSKGTTPWLQRQAHREHKSRVESERRVSTIMGGNEAYGRDEEEGRRP